MSLNTYENDLAHLHAYKNMYTSLQPLSSITDVRAPHIIFFFLLLPSSIAELNSIRCPRWLAAATARTRPHARRSGMQVLQALQAAQQAQLLAQ